MGLNVILIDDHTLFREGLEGLLSRRNINILAAVGNGQGREVVEAFVRPRQAVRRRQQQVRRALQTKLARFLFEREVPQLGLFGKCVAEGDSVIIGPDLQVPGDPAAALEPEARSVIMVAGPTGLEPGHLERPVNAFLARLDQLGP